MGMTAVMDVMPVNYPEYVLRQNDGTRFWREAPMKASVIAVAAFVSVLGVGSAQAQFADLTGQYQCIQNCIGPGLSYVTQYGRELSLVNETGAPSRAWIDYPGHIWAEYWHEGAVFSPDGYTIQFDSGSVWQRFTPAPPPLIRSRY
jgi:hypothetical protein